jgi:putative dnaQ family exonuclease/dinG family helicase
MDIMVSRAFEHDVFAVVDLETTGTQIKQHDRIIQFGCAIIKDRKITKTYSFLINPEKTIPRAVENLTGISNQEASKAQTFSFYAKKIQEILENTIFVAHNINFDLPFLNYELINAGLSPFAGKAIDTVELAQIAFPTIPSYKLQDITNTLHIKHANPHRADSDALVTAKMLLKIIEKIEMLPTATLNSLTSMSRGLLRNTYYIFSQVSTYARQEKRPLNNDLIQIKNIVIKKQDKILGKEKVKNIAFPKSDLEKRKLFKHFIKFRRGQVSLINRIHEFVINDSENNLIVEAPSGSGKTFAYLMAFAYNLYSSRKLVIAVPTKILQRQLISQEIKQLLKITNLDLNAEEVKSSRHYLDLDGFFNSIYQTSSDRQTLILQMSILVWLTSTETGDLDELQLTNYDAQIFNQITHPGDARVGTTFSNYDFWNLVRSKQEQADILVTNHAYLSNNYSDSIWGQNPFLVIDEAHRFIDNFNNSRSNSLQFETFWGACTHLQNILFYDKNCIDNRFSNDSRYNIYLENLKYAIIDLIHQINQIQTELFARIAYSQSRVDKGNNRVDVIFNGSELFSDVATFKQLFNLLQNKIEVVRKNTNEILFLLYEQENNIVNTDEANILELQESIDRFDYYSEQIYILLDQLNTKMSLEEEGYVLQISNINDPLTTNINWLMVNSVSEISLLYSYFTKKLFISATMSQNNNFDYIKKELFLANDTNSYLAKNTFDFSKRLNIIGLKDSQVASDPNSAEFTDFIAKFIMHSVQNMDHVLVLFTNLDTIKEVFLQIQTANELKDFEILAQGLTGSNERLAKRFSIAKRSILLGANSFWEGIDFKNCNINLVVVTKLPFESPDQADIKLREQKLRNIMTPSQIFENSTLPRAIIRFKQGCGRLIRNEYDKGTLVILDQRLWLKNYGIKFVENVPVTVEYKTFKDLQKALSKDK